MATASPPARSCISSSTCNRACLFPSTLQASLMSCGTCENRQARTGILRMTCSYSASAAISAGELATIAGRMQGAIFSPFCVSFPQTLTRSFACFGNVGSSALLSMPKIRCFAPAISNAEALSKIGPALLGRNSPPWRGCQMGRLRELFCESVGYAGVERVLG